eukprot:3491677-Prymnesium_polylepis.1
MCIRDRHSGGARVAVAVARSLCLCERPTKARCEAAPPGSTWSREVERWNADVCRRTRRSYDWFQRVLSMPDRALGSGGARGVHGGRRA